MQSEDCIDNITKTVGSFNNLHYVKDVRLTDISHGAIELDIVVIDKSFKSEAMVYLDNMVYSKIAEDIKSVKSLKTGIEVVDNSDNTYKINITTEDIDEVIERGIESDKKDKLNRYNILILLNVAMITVYTIMFADKSFEYFMEKRTSGMIVLSVISLTGIVNLVIWCIKYVKNCVISDVNLSSCIIKTKFHLGLNTLILLILMLIVNII